MYGLINNQTPYKQKYLLYIKENDITQNILLFLYEIK